MKFYKKLTLSLFFLSFGIVSTLCVALYFYLSQFIRTEILKNYNDKLSQLIDIFLELEKTTELIGLNALNSLKIIEEISGLPSDEQLKKIAEKSSINHIYITNASGYFIRSTNGPIKSNIFSYCSDYANLIHGNAKVFVTPIVPSSDEPTLGFYKYIMIPNSDRSKILEASIAFNFIGKFLVSSLNNNKDILSISLYTPTELLLGSVSRNDFIHEKTIRITKSFKDNSKNCCECKIKKLTNGESGVYYYKITVLISTKKISEALCYLSWGLFIAFIILTSLCFLVSRLLSNYLVARFQELHSKINRMISYDEEVLNLNMSGSDEIADVANQFDKLLIKLNENKKQLILSEKDRAISTLAVQLAHDIRSPLTALDVIVKHIENIPEEQRIIIRNSANRINDIANNLLTQYRQRKNPNFEDATSNVAAEMISDLLMSLMSEKRVQYKNTSIQFVFNIHENAYGKFSLISRSAFNRAISNLIDNSIEAMSSEITLTFSECKPCSNELELEIRDNGKGILPDILEKIIRGDSIATKVKGHGLGLSYVMKTIEEWGGRFMIHSTINVGTTIKIILQQSLVPEWFLSRLIFDQNKIIVILDDDESIHQVWKKRFKDIYTEVHLIHHYNPQELINCYQDNVASNYLYLIDYEFIGFKHTGLSIIKNLNISHQSYLVTSRHEDLLIRESCMKIGLKIIPKTFSAYIPIDMLNKSTLKFVDFIFIDDNVAITDAWILHGLTKDKKLAVYNSFQGFKVDIHNYDLNTPIYIDSDLNEAMSGQDYALQLYEEGFNNIYLATGYSREHFPKMHWIKEIVGKNPPF